MSTSSISGTPTYTNPVHPGYFADPFVFRHGDAYYAVGTGPAEAEGGAAGAVRNVFPMLTSPDLVHWTAIGHALGGRDPALELGDSFWAPEVAQAEGRFFLYYSVGHGDSSHHLRVAVSDLPAGPYRDAGALHAGTSPWPFAIDPHPFRDADGRWYLFFAADFLDSDPPGTPDGTRPGTALVVQPLEGMTRLAEGWKVVLRARCDWQRFQADRDMYGERYDWHTLEGPSVRRIGGRYYCFYSGGCWQTHGYGVDYAVADSVMGPYSGEGSESGPRILRTVPGHVLGPGHNSIVAGPDGESLYIAYHAWDPDKTARRLCIDPLVWTPEGPRCPGPSWTPRNLGGPRSAYGGIPGSEGLPAGA